MNSETKKIDRNFRGCQIGLSLIVVVCTFAFSEGSAYSSPSQKIPREVKNEILSYALGLEEYEEHGNQDDSVNSGLNSLSNEQVEQLIQLEERYKEFGSTPGVDKDPLVEVFLRTLAFHGLELFQGNVLRCGLEDEIQAFLREVTEIRQVTYQEARYLHPVRSEKVFISQGNDVYDSEKSYSPIEMTPKPVYSSFLNYLDNMGLCHLTRTSHVNQNRSAYGLSQLAVHQLRYLPNGEALDQKLELLKQLRGLEIVNDKSYDDISASLKLINPHEFIQAPNSFQYLVDNGFGVQNIFTTTDGNFGFSTPYTRFLETVSQRISSILDLSVEGHQVDGVAENKSLFLYTNFLVHNQQLISLRFNRIPLLSENDRTKMAPFASALKDHPHLENLAFNESNFFKIDPSRRQILLAGLLGSKNLKILNLDSNAPAKLEICYGLPTKVPSSADGVVALSKEVIAIHTTLKKLSLKQNLLGFLPKEALEVLAQAIAESRSLVEVDLRDNFISQENQEMIKSIVSSNSEKKVTLRFN